VSRRRRDGWSYYRGTQEIKLALERSRERRREA
jgi:hypothetical protein